MSVNRRDRARVITGLTKNPLRRLIPVPKSPPGWGLTEVYVRGKPLGFLERFSGSPVPDPPPSWAGTRPEWAVYWALTRLGFRDGLDFFYAEKVAGATLESYSEVDFYLPAYGIGIEILGTFWHYGTGEKVRRDAFRRAQLERYGIRVVFIDEDDALANPLFYVREALRGIDHSRMKDLA